MKKQLRLTKKIDYNNLAKRWMETQTVTQIDNVTTNNTTTIDNKIVRKKNSRNNGRKKLFYRLGN